MGWLSDLFGQKQETQSQQSGTSTTQNNAFPDIQNWYKSAYFPQFSAGNISSAQTPITPYQYAAANNQMGATAYSPFAQATGANIASNGIQPSSISSFMSPYISNVVDATRNDFNTQNARQLSSVAGQAAKAGARGGTQGVVAKNLAMESQRRTQDPIIANLYNQGYGQAADLANKDINARLAGIGAINQTTGATTGANTGLAGIGSTMWGQQYQNMLTPFNLTTQGASGLSNYMQGAGQTTNSSGTSSGTTQSNPGLMQSLMGLGGLGLAGYDYGGQKGWWANGGRVNGYADGGAVEEKPNSYALEPFHNKIEKAFHVMHRLKRFAKGGEVLPRYDGGGTIGPWETTIDRAPSAPSPEANLASSLKGIGDNLKPYTPSGSDIGGGSGLSKFMSGVEAANRMPRYAKGGDVDWPSVDGSPEFGAPDDSGPMYAGFRGVSPDSTIFPPYSRMEPSRGALAPYSETRPAPSGVPASAAGTEPIASSVRPLSPEMQLASVLLSGSPIAGSGKAILEMQSQRLQEEQNKRAAAMDRARMAQEAAIATGHVNINGTPTETIAAKTYGLHAAKNPSEIAANEARSVAGQRAVKEFEYTTQKDLDALKDLRALETKIDTAVMWGTISSEEGEKRKRQARELYERSRSMIREAPKSPSDPVRPPLPGGVLGTPPPGAPPPGSTIILEGGKP